MGVIVAQFVGIGAATELFGISKYVSVPLACAVIWYLVVAGSYGRVEKVFVVMTLGFLAYLVTAILAKPDWHEVARGALPSFRMDPEYLLLFVALVGTTITPFMPLFQQSSVVEKGVARRHYGPERLDAYIGSIFSNFVAIMIIIATGATLHAAGTTELETAAQAAEVLRPAAGDAAQVLFAVGLIGACLIAAGVLPLTTAYAVSEAFGFTKGINLDFRRARIFFTLFSVLLVGGTLVALVPGIPFADLLVGVSTLNGILLPVLLLFLLRLINDRRIAGDLRNGTVTNLLGWGTFVFVVVSVAALLASEALGWVGVDVFAGLGGE
jgi:Mn2+/Fe2+ NRAMP family transporter